jgi:hypothetical protein
VSTSSLLEWKSTRWGWCIVTRGGGLSVG